MADERLSASVRALRESLDMSQAELARQMSARGWGWHQSTVTRVEAGRQSVRFAQAVDLADILHTSLDRLTWTTAEAGETAMVNAVGARVRESYRGVADAVLRLRADLRAAERTLGTSAASKWPRVHEALEDLENTVQWHQVGAAVEEGETRYEQRHEAAGQEGEG